MMLFGQKAKIAYEVFQLKDGLVQMDIYLNNQLLTVDDNFHYYPMVINYLKQEIENFINEQSFVLKFEYQNLSLDEIFNLICEDEIQVYKYSMNCKNLFSYDLSTKTVNISVIVKEDDLLFFGKFYDSQNMMQVMISRNEYIGLIQNVLDYLYTIKQVS